MGAAAIAVLAGVASATPYSDINAAAARDPVIATPLRGGLTMLSGSGGNIAVLRGPRGLFLVDAGIAVSEPKIRHVLREISPEPIRYVVLTHWHWDHTDGDAWMRRSGARLLASPAAVRRLGEITRVEEWGHTFPPIATADRPAPLPAADDRMRFGGETVRIRNYSGGHTDGDLSVHFQRADVLSTGDTFWNGVYPFIDYAGGGGVDGAICEADANLAIAGPHTLVIPGHGPVGSRADLQAFRDMLVTVRGRVAALKSQGLSVDEVIAARPTKDLDGHWGRSVISGELFTRLVYRGL